MTEKKSPTIFDNCKISLNNAGSWIGPADLGAVTTLLRLARLIDDLLDMGETKDLAPLLSRLSTIMDQLQLTPKSRIDQDLSTKKEESNGDEFQEGYLRIVNPADPIKSRPGKKSGSISK
jgi:hypothetical protein